MDPTTGGRVLTVVASGVLGLVIGSFLNVVVHRLPRGMSLARPPSHCPACGTELRAWDNVPLVSWALLRGRCRDCSAPISIRYPLVELTAGVAFLGLALALGPVWPLPSLLLVASAAIAATAVDLDGPLVPWSVGVAAAVGAVSLVVVAATAGQPGRVGWAALGGAASGAAALALDRTGRGARCGAVVAALGWSAGWLWLPGGPVLAGWVVVLAGATTWAAGRDGARRTLDREVGPGEGGRPRTVLLPASIGAYGLLVAGAALGAVR